MAGKVRKTLNIDAAKLKRVQRYLGVDTETEAIDRALDAYDHQRELAEILRGAAPSWKEVRTTAKRRRARSRAP